MGFVLAVLLGLQAVPTEPLVKKGTLYLKSRDAELRKDPEFGLWILLSLDRPPRRVRRSHAARRCPDAGAGNHAIRRPPGDGPRTPGPRQIQDPDRPLRPVPRGQSGRRRPLGRGETGRSAAASAGSAEKGRPSGVQRAGGPRPPQSRARPPKRRPEDRRFRELAMGRLGPAGLPPVGHGFPGRGRAQGRRVLAGRRP